MTENARHTLLNLEAAPPEGAWENIAARLNTEFDPNESKVSEKLSGFELAPPSAVWEKVAAGLQEEQPALQQQHRPAIVRSLRKWVAASAAILVVALGAWYFFRDNASPQKAITNTEPQHQPPAAAQQVAPEAGDVARSTLPPDVDEARPLPRRSRSRSAAREDYRKMVISTAAYIPEVPFIEMAANLPHAAPDAIHAVETVAPPNVEAPPIRDANGNIILDTHLIFAASDNHYIVVTSPNGQQTRMSSKFLPLLSSLNGNPESLEYFQYFLNENNMWKLRFNEWRDKMLKQASFIPAATNFLDLLELKEILLEN